MASSKDLKQRFIELATLSDSVRFTEGAEAHYSALKRLAEDIAHEEAVERARTESETWSPDIDVPFASHVKARWTGRALDPDTLMPIAQQIVVRCTFPGCNAEWKGVCTSGRVRELASKFALNHLHRDVMQVPKHKATP